MTRFSFLAWVITVLAFAAPAPAVAEMQVRLKDGRVLTLPVSPDEVDSISFGKSGSTRPPSAAARAADQLRQDGDHVRSAAEAAARASAAADRAEAAAVAARQAQSVAARAAAAAQRTARQPPPPSSPPSTLADGAKGGRVLVVGPGAPYAVPSQAAAIARDGDVVEIRAGTYTGDVAVWRANNMVIRGVGGKVRLEAAGRAAEGKAIWVIKGNNTTVQNITFSGCRVRDFNGAGIRQEGSGLIVRHSYFFGNEIGLLAGGGGSSDVLIEHTEFGANRIDYDRYAREGHPVPGGIQPGHNIYIGRVRSFTLRFSYVHHAGFGHNVKSRARRNVIAYNRIGDEKDGNSSYAVDLSEGGWTLLVGNVIQQGEKVENSTVVSHGAETRTGSEPLYVVNNTFVNDRGAGTFVRRSTPGPTLVINNIFAGGGAPLQGGGTLRSNLVIERRGLGASLFGLRDAEARPGSGGLAGNLVAGSAGFVDAGNYDYRLVAGSPAIDAGEDPGSADGVSLAPDSQYRHPLVAAPRQPVRRMDIGAYEFTDGG